MTQREMASKLCDAQIQHKEDKTQSQLYPIPLELLGTFKDMFQKDDFDTSDNPFSAMLKDQMDFLKMNVTEQQVMIRRANSEYTQKALQAAFKKDIPWLPRSAQYSPLNVLMALRMCFSKCEIFSPHVDRVRAILNRLDMIIDWRRKMNKEYCQPFWVGEEKVPFASGHIYKWLNTHASFGKAPSNSLFVDRAQQSGCLQSKHLTFDNRFVVMTKLFRFTLDDHFQFESRLCTAMSIVMRCSIVMLGSFQLQ